MGSTHLKRWRFRAYPCFFPNPNVSVETFGPYRWFWTAWLAAKWYLYLHPYGEAVIERQS